MAEFGGKGNIQKLVAGFQRAFTALGTRPPDGVSPWFYPSVAEYMRECSSGTAWKCGKRPFLTGRRCWKRANESWRAGFACSGRRLWRKWGKRRRSGGFVEVQRQCRGELFRDEDLENRKWPTAQVFHRGSDTKGGGGTVAAQVSVSWLGTWVLCPPARCSLGNTGCAFLVLRPGTLNSSNR